MHASIAGVDVQVRTIVRPRGDSNPPIAQQVDAKRRDARDDGAQPQRVLAPAPQQRIVDVSLQKKAALVLPESLARLLRWQREP